MDTEKQNKRGFNLAEYSKLHGAWNKGKKLSEEHKQKLRGPRPSVRGTNHFRFSGGISRLYRSLRLLVEYKQWRAAVFERDGWRCRTCGITGVYVTAHHKISFRTIIKINNITTTEEATRCKDLWNIDNGVTLCEECHKLTDNYKGRAKGKIKI